VEGECVPGRILQEDIEALKRRVDIADVVGDHTNLKRSGARMKGLCPLHEERTPSFSVDPAVGMWHCFGCQEGGDVYTFLERVEGLTFVEAVEHLARRTGYQLRYEEMSAGQKRALGRRTRLVAVNRAAVDFYRDQLLSPVGEPARRYLKERGFHRDEAEHFLLGFAPMEWDALSRRLRNERHAEEELVEAGLAVRNRRGGLRDRFRGRLLFPVLDRNGDPIGFGGRVLPDLDYGDHDPPKYLNTPETPLYRKHEVLYGMSWARPEMVRVGDVLVCEGYTDVIALHQAGFTNAVATCGTAVGEDHLRALERYVERVVLAFDADEAGQRAAERAQGIARGRDLEVRVLIMPEGTDPADAVRDGGADAMRELVERAEPVLRFSLRRALRGHDASPEGRTSAVEATAPILAEIEDAVLRDQYTRWVADTAGVGLAVVAGAVQRAGGELPALESSDGDRTGEQPARRDASARAQLEREVLRVALQRPDLLPERWAEVSHDDLVHPKARAVFDALAAAGGPAADVEAVLEHADDDETRALVRAIRLEDFTVEPDRPHVEMIIGRLLLHRIEREIGERKVELERMNPTTDPDGYRDRFQALVTLEARRRDLREVATG
jgi:DNA primase